MSTLTIRLPDEKRQLLKALAENRKTSTELASGASTPKHLFLLLNL